MLLIPGGDDSVNVIKKMGVEYIISSYNCSKCSDKVRAISTAIDRYRDYDVYLLADSQPNLFSLLHQVL